VNAKFPDLFVVPENVIGKPARASWDWTNPKREMAKSAESEYNYVSVWTRGLDRKKLAKAVGLDSGPDIPLIRKSVPRSPNLLSIYSAFSKESIEALWSLPRKRASAS